MKIKPGDRIKFWNDIARGGLRHQITGKVISRRRSHITTLTVDTGEGIVTIAEEHATLAAVKSERQGPFNHRIVEVS